MLNAAINNSELNNLLDAVLSVDLCKKFKPAAAVYQLVLNQYPKNEHEFLFFFRNCGIFTVLQTLVSKVFG